MIRSDRDIQGRFEKRAAKGNTFHFDKNKSHIKRSGHLLVSSGRTCSIRLMYFLFISQVVILVLQLSPLEVFMSVLCSKYMPASRQRNSGYTRAFSLTNGSSKYSRTVIYAGLGSICLLQFSKNILIGVICDNSSSVFKHLHHS